MGENSRIKYVRRLWILSTFWLVIFCWPCEAFRSTTTLPLPSAVLSTLVRRNRVPKRSLHKSALPMAFNTFVRVESSHETKCSLKHDPGVSLTDYMRLPVEQYVCLQMPLNATLERLPNNQFNLTVPPVRFFHLDVSPMLLCDVAQTADSVTISSQSCVLRGSKTVENLNGCFHIKVATKIRWLDTRDKRTIQSSSKIFVEVDPPKPFKYLGKTILENTGNLAMGIALRQIESAFVHSLAKDYEKWATNKDYREARALMSIKSHADGKDFMGENIAIVNTHGMDPADVDTDVDLSHSVSDNDSMRESADSEFDSSSTTCENNYSSSSSSLLNNMNSDKVQKEASVGNPSQFLSTIIAETVCFLHDKNANHNNYQDKNIDVRKEPSIIVNIAPQNSRRIYSGIDIAADWNTVWQVLTDYEQLTSVIPSLLVSTILERFADGGARVIQVGGAKILPGLTFKAKTVLDVHLYNETHPMPNFMFLPDANNNYNDNQDKSCHVDVSLIPLRRGMYPRPSVIPNVDNMPYRDITMQNNVQYAGDFEHYQGVWRVQSIPSVYAATNRHIHNHMKNVTRLTYAVEIKPKGLLPVHLIESRIVKDLKENLEAIRKRCEELQVSLCLQECLQEKQEQRQLLTERKMLETEYDNIEISESSTSFITKGG